MVPSIVRALLASFAEWFDPLMKLYRVKSSMLIIIYYSVLVSL
uniref:Uncharacterized protein n=1 Tax=Arundo donax TaxID=35708 RepID=A0A0A9EHE0_ARUDO